MILSILGILHADGPENSIWSLSSTLMPQTLAELYYLVLGEKIFFFFFFLAVLGLPCCAWAFSSCGERGLLFLAVH